jgi:hypothetical protein
MRLLNHGPTLLRLVALVAVVSACSVYDKSLLSPGNPATDSAPAKCESVQWPDRPKNATPGGGNDFVAALRYFDFGEPYIARGTTPARVARDVPLQGYDLDHRCTANSDFKDDPTLIDPPSCRDLPGMGEGVFGKHGDLPGGRDNGLRNVIEDVAKFFQEFGTPTYNGAIEKGQVSLLFEIKDYNGEPNDDAVTVSIYTPVKLIGSGDASLPSGDAAADGGPSIIPQFNGEDTWTVAYESYLENEPAKGPRVFSADAYVANNMLVSSIDRLDMRLRIGISPFKLVDLNVNFVATFFTAKIAKENGLWELKDGTIVGRWRTKDLFGQVKYFPNPYVQQRADAGPGKYQMCTNLDSYELVHQLICQAADIYSGPETPDPACDAISVAIGFRAVQAKLGGFGNLEPLENECTSRYDPMRDSCDYTWRQQLERGIRNPLPEEDASTDSASD